MKATVRHAVEKKPEVRRHGLIGRERELERLVTCLADSGPAVTFVYGAPGVGKSALLAAFTAYATTGGWEVVGIECRDVEPTPRAFLDELGRALDGELDDLERLSSAFACRGRPVVIVLDTYERFRLIDRWVREELVPELPAGAKLVLAGRDAPLPAWSLSAPAPELFALLSLGGLADADAIAFLRGAGLADNAAKRLARLSRGHPLTLRLAAAAALAQPELDIDEQAAPAVFEALTRLYVADLPAPTRRALDAASVVRRVTLPLLAAMLTDVEAERAFEDLTDLPFVEVARDGLVLHEALQEAIARRLRAADPERYRAHRANAWRQLRREARTISHEELWRYTADMLYLIENPVVREAFFPASSQRVSVAPATPADRAKMRAIVRAHELAPEAELLWSWLELAEDACQVARTDEVVGGFSIATRITDIPARIRQADPVVGAWREHLHANPVAPGEIVLVLRRWLDRDLGEAPSPTQAALWLDVKRTYMELRPDLRRLYTVLRDPGPYLPVMVELGFVPLEPIKVGASMFHPVCLDFGPGSVDGWLAGLAARELGVDDTSLLDPQARELIIDGRRLPLTRIELTLTELLLARAGAVVSRQEILHTVWHTDHEGSNIIEAAVGSLRRKLGPEAQRLETVRGVGYRLRAG
jgi:Transcriptional regulatory protein, C terminal/AAA ATPase domain